MLGFKFYEWYLESPNQVGIALLIMIFIVVIGFCIMHFAGHKDKV